MALKSKVEINETNSKNKEEIITDTDVRKTVSLSNYNIINTTEVNKRVILSYLGLIEVGRQKKVKDQVKNLTDSEYKYFMASPAPMATYYNQYQIPQAYNLPVMVTEWSPLVSTVQVRNIYTSPYQHIPVAIISPQLITPICPYAGALITADPILSSVVPNTVIPETVPPLCTSLYSQMYKTEVDYGQESMSTTIEVFNDQDSAKESALPERIAEDVISESKVIDPVEFYLTLPKELFPTARMLAIDPNLKSKIHFH